MLISHCVELTTSIFFVPFVHQNAIKLASFLLCLVEKDKGTLQRDGAKNQDGNNDDKDRAGGKAALALVPANVFACLPYVEVESR